VLREVVSKAAVGADSALMEDEEAVKENVRIWRHLMNEKASPASRLPYHYY